MEDRVEVLISGDFCPIHRVEALALKGGHEQIFNDLLPPIQQADIAITNLECPLIDAGTPMEKFGPALKAPVQTVKCLADAGFNLVTLANNHIMDYGEQGLTSTIRACGDNGIDHVGAGRNVSDARRILYKTVNGRRLAFVNVAENEFSTTKGNEAGANPLNPIWNYYDIRKARQNADVVFAIVHGGLEHCPLPGPDVKARLRFFVDAGANAVISHHTHCYSGYEMYNGAPIFHGLGNFVFDHPSRRNGHWNSGMIVHFTITGGDLQFERIGIVQCDADTVGARRMKGEETRHFDQEVRRMSDIITDDQLLENEWRNYIASKRNIYQAMTLVGNSYLRKAIHRKIVPVEWATNANQRKLVLNVLRCESLREAAIQAMELDK
jgi:poly-gamma-glutamate capsule biosynthesis protein CapA/YwtB (metallophosphatase superfamily)